MANSFWTTEIPIWVSRKTSDGLISQFAVSGWVFLLLGFLATFNAVFWGFYGVVQAIELVV
jgi:hypothetical protein